MADSYALWSDHIEDLTDPEIAWLRAFLLKYDPTADENDENHIACDYEAMAAEMNGRIPDLVTEDELEENWYSTWETFHLYEDRKELAYYDEQGGACLDTVVSFLRYFLAIFRPNAVLTLEWAFTCSRPICGEFGGGVAVFSSRTVEWLNTGSLGEDKKRTMEKEMADASL